MTYQKARSWLEKERGEPAGVLQLAWCRKIATALNEQHAREFLSQLYSPVDTYLPCFALLELKSTREEDYLSHDSPKSMEQCFSKYSSRLISGAGKSVVNSLASS